MFNESINYEDPHYVIFQIPLFFVHLSSLPCVLHARGSAWSVPLI